MAKSIQWKILTMFILLIIAVMCFIGAFSIQGISSYYHNEFSKTMGERAFNAEVINQLTAAVTSEKPTEKLTEILNLYSVRLGIDSYRNFYILDGHTASCLAGGSNELLPENYEITPNILSAMTGQVGSAIKSNQDFMDYAYPIATNGDVKYIVYVRDSKDEMREVMRSIFSNILSALLFGLLLSVVLGFFLSKTIISPLSSLQNKAEKMAAGNFGHKIEVKSNDEIGRLTKAFNEMANELRTNLQEIASEKNKVETILLYMTDGIMAFNIDGSLMHINPAAEKMFHLANAQDLQFEPFFSSIQVDVAIEQFLYLDGRGPLEKEIQFRQKHIRAHFAPFKMDGKRPSGVVVVFHDITRQQKLDDSRREFVANVSHELRTPLTTIKSYTETLIQYAEPEKDDFQMGFLKIIDGETDRMTRIVKDLLTLSRLDNSKEVKKEKFDLGVLTRDVVRKLGLEAKNNNIYLTAIITPDIPPFFGDRDRIEQVITNIVSNAVKYTRENGSVEVSCGYQLTYAYIKVKDNGIGIPKEDLPRIFERFYRVDKARSRDMGGTGLGLAIAKEIVEAHGGKIKIDSEVGKGTEVFITMPLYSE